MKKNSLTTAVIAGLAGVAGFAGLVNAVELNPDGIGQVLIYPYYTVNKGQDTLFSVVNTADVGKAVKVRFIEGYNSREVLDFNLFLSPYDVWVASVSEFTAGGAGAVRAWDNSCTWPVGGLKTGKGEKFRTSMFDGTVGPKDGAPTGAARTREGYLEMILMGDVNPGTNLFKTILHGPSGSPKCDQGVLAAAGGDVSAPLSGGLFGSGTVANVAEGTFFGYNADAIDGFSSNALYSAANALTPALSQANTSYPTTPPGGATAYIFSNGHLIHLDYTKGIDAVSAVFTADAIYNEYQVGDGVNSDWVVNFPTKRFYVDKFSNGNVAAITPFVENFAGGSNIQIGLNMYDREEGELEEGACGGFSPPNPGEVDCGIYLPWEVNVISFMAEEDFVDGGEVSGVFGSNLVSNLEPFAPTGWLKIDLVNDASGAALDGGDGHELRADVNNHVVYGLPVTGFHALNFVNSQLAGGVLANYSGVYRHRASRLCIKDPNGGHPDPLACS